jgi:hypothetical protein
MLRAEIEIAHFGATPIDRAHPYWKLADVDGRVHASGEFPPRELPVGNGIALGHIEIPLDELPAPRQYRLIAGLAGTEFENDWDIWVYPAVSGIPASDKVLIVHEWGELLQKAKEGRRILFNPPPSEVHSDVALGFSPIFWNTAWTKKQAPHTLGLLCDPSHPLFASFPTEPHSNWQWWEIVHGAAALAMNELPPEVFPLVQVIDDWFTNRRLGLVFEACLNGCHILVCGSDITTNLAGRLAARQFRYALLDYMAGSSFCPQFQIAPKALGRVLGHQSA